MIEEIVDSLERFDELHFSSGNDQIEKRYLSDHFFSMCSTNMFADGLVENVFFEAGSTVDYFARGLLRLLTEDESFSERNGELNIFMNGVVTKFAYDLRRRTIPFVKKIEYLPEPPASAKYGKNLGILRTVSKIPALQQRDAGQRDDAIAAGNEIVAELKEKIGEAAGLLVMSVSGFDVKMGFSPFTKSYRNFVFKKAAFESGIPKILIFDGSKWGGINIKNPANNIADGYYHFGVFEEWIETVDRSPFAVLVSTKVPTTKNSMIEKFCEAGMRCTPTKRGEYDLLFIYNQKFADKFGVFGEWERND